MKKNIYYLFFLNLHWKLSESKLSIFVYKQDNFEYEVDNTRAVAAFS